MLTGSFAGDREAKIAVNRGEPVAIFFFPVPCALEALTVINLLSIPTHENKVKQNLKCLPSNIRGWFRGTPFRSPLQGGLKGLGARGGGGRRSEGRRGLHLRKASRGLEGGLKGASRGLQGGLKGASPSEGFKGLEGGFTFGRQAPLGFKGPL